MWKEVKKEIPKNRKELQKGIRKHKLALFLGVTSTIVVLPLLLFLIKQNIVPVERHSKPTLQSPPIKKDEAQGLTMQNAEAQIEQLEKNIQEALQAVDSELYTSQPAPEETD